MYWRGTLLIVLFLCDLITGAQASTIWGTAPCEWSTPCAEKLAGIRCSKEGHVIDLDLYKRNLNGTIPDTIGNMVHLTVLQLSRNQLSGLSGTIPSSIGSLTKLFQLCCCLQLCRPKPI
eukprot:m51a1_g8088 putative probable leucine-rich repeat receptor-like protein kinase at5g49770-like (119) ;mRNA; r:42757-43511